MSVDWDDDIQVKEVCAISPWGFSFSLVRVVHLGVTGGQASELLQRWAPIQVEDALGLLMPEFSHGVVREFAVSVLSHATDEDLVSYLLQVKCNPVSFTTHVCSCALGWPQLVQALRYEPSLRAEDSEKSSDPSVVSMDDGLAARKKYKLSPLADFLISRAVRRWDTFLYHFCRVFCLVWMSGIAGVYHGSIEVANYLSWFLLVEIEDDKHGAMFARVYSGMTQALERLNSTFCLASDCVWPHGCGGNVFQ
jgi:Phosphoinositide 3-kinase family, accessory domain (PIK domain)